MNLTKRLQAHQLLPSPAVAVATIFLPLSPSFPFHSHHVPLLCFFFYVNNKETFTNHLVIYLKALSAKKERKKRKNKQVARRVAQRALVTLTADVMLRVTDTWRAPGL